MYCTHSRSVPTVTTPGINCKHNCKHNRYILVSQQACTDCNHSRYIQQAQQVCYQLCSQQVFTASTTVITTGIYWYHSRHVYTVITAGIYCKHSRYILQAQQACAYCDHNSIAETLPISTHNIYFHRCFYFKTSYLVLRDI